eukprot:596819-Pyramimonas_sp.AAC.1
MERPSLVLDPVPQLTSRVGDASADVSWVGSDVTPEVVWEGSVVVVGMVASTSGDASTLGTPVIVVLAASPASKLAPAASSGTVTPPSGVGNVTVKSFSVSANADVVRSSGVAAGGVNSLANPAPRNSRFWSPAPLP